MRPRISFLIAVLLATSTARATVPNTFSVQGVLRDGMGKLQTTTVDVTVKLFDAQTMGTLLAGPYESTSVMATNGLFTFPIPPDPMIQTKLGSAAQVWLEVTVGSDTFARQLVTPQLFALMCGTADVAKSLPGVTVVNGNVGIGTASPGAKLQIDQTEGSGLLQMRNSSNGSSWTVRLQGDGNSPNNFHLDGPGGADALIVRSTGKVGIGTANPYTVLEAAASDPAQLTLRQTGSSKRAALDFAAASVEFEMGTDVNKNGGHNFYLYDIVAPAVRLFIDANGNTGIGTAGPQSNLHVVGHNITDGSGNVFGLLVDPAGGVGQGGMSLGMTPTASAAVIQTFNNAPLALTPHLGGVDIGTTAALPAGVALQVAGGNIQIGTSGTIGCVQRGDGTGIAGTCSSDARLKKNVVALSNALDKLTSLRPVSYEWRKEEFPERHFGAGKQTGLIAQEVEKVLPELVATDEKGYKAVSYGVPLEMLLIQSVKELRAENAGLKARLERIEARLGQRAAR
jgi:hypothetical protein